MATKKSKKQVVNTEVNETEVRRAWLQSFTAPKSSASRLCTLALTKNGGVTIDELKTICKQYAQNNGNKQKWGTSKTSDLTSHFRWLRGKGYTIKQDEKSQKYSLTV